MGEDCSDVKGLRWKGRLMNDNQKIKKKKALLNQATGLTKQQQTVQAKIEELKAGLPHLYDRKYYTWAHDFFHSRNKMTLLCAGNQMGKSSIQIRKIIEWAGNPKLWPELWPLSTPKQFWYLYPSKSVSDAEFKLKWVPEFLPRGSYKNHSTYGWKELRAKDGSTDGIEFNSGVSIFFKSYMQNVQNLQTGTCHYVACDEELVEDLFGELQSRMSAAEVQGYFSMVFTATLNQPMWHRAMEGKGDAELFPDALKINASLWDCVTYKDGSPGPYTEEIIRQRIAQCPTEAEVQKRIYGRFVSTAGKKYAQFDPSRHFIKPFAIRSLSVIGRLFLVSFISSVRSPVMHDQSQGMSATS